MPTELATGYVSILPSTRGFGSALSKQLGGAVSASGRAGGDAGTSFGSKLTSGARAAMSKIASSVVTVAKVGTAGMAATVAGALYKGFGRLSTIEDSTQALTISLGSSKDAGVLLGKTLEVVSGTPFALDQFAQATQQLVTMGVSANKVPGYLTAIGDAAATKGSRANEFASRLAEQFGQISAQGRITGGDILQMSQTGVNALTILANHYGVSTEAMQDMVSKGLVPAGEGLDAIAAGIENGSNGIAGLTPQLGGLSKSLGETASGSLANMVTGFKRMGATMLQPVFPLMPPLFNAITGTMDVLGKGVAAVVQRFVSSPGFADKFNTAVRWIQDQAPVAAMYIVSFGEKIGAFIGKVKNSEGFQTFTDRIKDLADKLKSFSPGDTLTKVGDVLTNDVIPALKKFKPEPLIQFLKNLATAGKTSGKGVLVSAVVGLPAFVTLVNILTTLVSKVPPNVLVAIFAAVAGFKVASNAATGLKSISSGISGITSAGKSVGTAFTTIKAGITSMAATKGVSNLSATFGVLKSSIMETKVVQLAQAAASKVAAAAQWLWNAAMTANPIGLIVAGIAALIAGLVLAYNKVGWFRDFVNAVFGGIKTVVMGVVNWVRDNWPLLLAILTGPIGLAVLIITKNWDTIKAAFTAVKDWIRDRISDIVGFITGIPGRIRSGVDSVLGIFKGPFTSAKNWVKDRIEDIVSFAKGLPGKIRSAFATLGSAIKQPFVSAFDAVRDLWNATIGKIHFKVPGWVPKFGGKGFSFPPMHTGGIVPGGASNEPIYKLQGGEGVIPREGMAALAAMFDRPAPATTGMAGNVTGVHADQIVIEDKLTAEAFFRQAEFLVSAGRL